MSRPSRILLGVTGGIAAFKAPALVRRFRERGDVVRCVMTRSAEAFVTPLTLEVVSGHPVYREEYLAANDSGEELHLTAAQWADVLCVAPATCHTLARLALGLADDFLTTTALAFSGPIVVAPAMAPVMWSQETVQEHLATLRRRGATVVGPVEGQLATGSTGMGRMSEPEEIVQEVELVLGRRDLIDKTVLVTAGPTREPIDPIRFLSNRSSGKMGFELAAEAAQRGARALLVAGPVTLDTPVGVDRLDVGTAREMRDAVYEFAPEADLIIMTAAVADFRPREISPEKIKKREGLPSLELAPNPDILAGLSDVAPQALRVGFAAETHNVIEEARAKLESKKLDVVVANDVSRTDIGIGREQNELTVIRADRGPVFLGRESKRILASKLMDLLSQEMTTRAEATSPANR